MRRLKKEDHISILSSTICGSCFWRENSRTSGSLFKLDILRVTKSNSVTLDGTFEVTTMYGPICLKVDGHLLVAGTSDHTTHVCIISFIGEEKDYRIYFPNKDYSVDTSFCVYIMSSDKWCWQVYKLILFTRMILRQTQEPYWRKYGNYMSEQSVRRKLLENWFTFIIQTPLHTYTT
jgi:hypothetical protein